MGMRRVVAYIMRHNGERVLLVRRSKNHESLGNTWTLPASTVLKEESWEEAVVRSITTKFRDPCGRKIIPREVREVCQGDMPVGAGTLRMKLFELEFAGNVPFVPVASVTRGTEYRECSLLPTELVSTVLFHHSLVRGSLGAALYLVHAGGDSNLDVLDEIERRGITLKSLARSGRKVA